MIIQFVKSHFKVVLVPLLLLLLALSLPLGIFLINAMKHPLLGIHTAGKRIVHRSQEIQQKAHKFGEQHALRQLGQNSINGYTYRFDDNILDAHPKGRLSSLGGDKESVGIAFDFENDSNPGLLPKKRDHTIAAGVLRCRLSRDNYLENDSDLMVDIGRVAEIEMRLKVERSKTVVLGWSSRKDAHPLDPKTTDYLKIRTVPDGRFHTYRINARPVLKSFSLSGDAIRRLFLFPLEIDTDEIELDYLRFYSMVEKYGRKAYDVVYETIDNEMRPGIYMHTATSLRYPLRLPPGDNRLVWGMGLLTGNKPVKFTITVESQGASIEVFSETVSVPGTWHDRKVDLSQFSDRSISVSFSLQGAPDSIAIWSNPRILTPPRERFNVVMVLEDALRADRLSSYGYQFLTTPVKDALAAKGVLFENAFSQATHTRASCASFMTSLYPSATGVWNAGEVLDDNYLTLAEIMRSQGYVTASFIQNVNAGPNAGLHQGFSYLSNTEASGSRAVQVYQGQRLRKWLMDHSRTNFFLYLHILDPHGPYDPPESITERYKNKPIPGKIPVKRDPLLDPEWLESPTAESRNFLYNDEIVVNDVVFKSFLEQLEDLQLTQNTLIIFISDHGEHMGEHGLWDHKPPGFQQVLHVPLLMVHPQKLPAQRRLARPVQLMDIMPTILDLARIPTRGFMIQGDSLMSLISGENEKYWRVRGVLSEEVKLRQKDDRFALGSFFYGGHHLLYSDRLLTGWAKKNPANASRKERLAWIRIFDLTEDPVENFISALIGTDMILHSRTEALFKELRRINLGIWLSMAAQQETTITYDPSEMKQLRELGYIK
jgi:arylsulfatase